jgi:hypothetical protein
MAYDPSVLEARWMRAGFALAVAVGEEPMVIADLRISSVGASNAF